MTVQGNSVIFGKFITPMRIFLFFLLSMALICTVEAQDYTGSQNQQAQQVLAEKGEMVIKFNVSSRSQINNDLTHILSIDQVKPLVNGQGFEVRAYANQHGFDSFLTRNIPYEIVPKIIPKALTMATTIGQMANWDRYPVYSVYEQMMADFASNYPSLCRIDTILSTTPSGNYRILVAKITDNVNTPENEPQFLYSSSMHGDETTGYILMLRLIDYLLTNYGVLPKVTNLVNNAEIWICPLANPEGTYRNSVPPGSTVANSQRFNLANVDLNRNYPDPRSGQHPDGESWQPETQAFMTFADDHHFNIAANFHGGAEVLNYPWDTWTSAGNPNAHAAWWERVCTAYVDTARIITSSYLTDVVPDGVSAGGDWYIITGGRQDYMNYFKQCREVTIELDANKTTPTENLNIKWNQNYRSFLNFIQESLNGLRGVITDSCTGQPIRAKVWANTDQINDSSQVYSALPVGNYHKYMIAGTYSLTFSAPGYTAKTMNGITLVNGAASILNIQLAPATPPIVQFTGTLFNSCSGTVQFNNTSVSASSFIWDFGDGLTSIQENPIHTYQNNGTYTVKLKAYNCKGSDSLIRTNYITINMIPAPVVNNGSRCGNGIVALNASGSGTIKWFDAPFGGNLLFTGTNFTTPAISTTTTFYAANDLTPPPVTAGMVFTGSGGSGTSSGQHYLIFDAVAPFTLISVKVNNTSTTSLVKTIQLQDAFGNIISGQETTVNIPVGTSQVNLNFSVPIGTNHRLVCTNGTNLYRHNSSVSYPYTNTGLLSITGCDAGSTYYYYFYEWQVQQAGCTSSLVPVIASILTVPVAAFTKSVAGGTVSFTNASTDASSYQWNFGDGGNSTLTDPIYTYTANGTYTVQLIAMNNSCSDTITQNVIISSVGGIEDPLFESVSILPNPVHDKLFISFGSMINEDVTFEIINLSGKLVYNNKCITGNLPIIINLEHLSKGMYILKIRNKTTQIYYKVIKT